MDEEIKDLKKAIKLLYLMNGGNDLIGDEEREWFHDYVSEIKEL